MRGNNIISHIYSRDMPVPFLSVVIDDCIARGRDYNAGGARYNTRYIQGVGIGSVADSLAALKYHVFDHGMITMKEMLHALETDFSEQEKLRRELVEHTPKYGNDDDYVDDLMRKVFDLFFHSIDNQPAGNGAVHRIDMLPTTSHVYFGSVIGALPDGRRAGQPLSEGISPVQGADRNGPTAVMKSAAKMDQLKTGGTLLNQKFTPQLLKDEKGILGLLHLIRSYFRMDGHHVQFNVVDAATLRQARLFPEQYRNLIVRVAGYSDYFVDLTPELQEEIICRTENQSFA